MHECVEYLKKDRMNNLRCMKYAWYEYLVGENAQS